MQKRNERLGYCRDLMGIASLDCPFGSGSAMAGDIKPILPMAATAMPITVVVQAVGANSNAKARAAQQHRFSSPWQQSIGP
jgi:hypothetical protein